MGKTWNPIHIYYFWGYLNWKVIDIDRYCKLWFKKTGVITIPAKSWFTSRWAPHRLWTLGQSRCMIGYEFDFLKKINLNYFETLTACQRENPTPIRTVLWRKGGNHGIKSQAIKWHLCQIFLLSSLRPKLYPAAPWISWEGGRGPARDPHWVLCSGRTQELQSLHSFKLAVHAGRVSYTPQRV